MLCVKYYVYYVLRVHNGHPLFSVSCKLCGGTWKKNESISKHVFCKHPGSDLFPLADGSHLEQSVGTSVDEPLHKLESYRQQLTKQETIPPKRTKTSDKTTARKTLSAEIAVNSLRTKCGSELLVYNITTIK